MRFRPEQHLRRQRDFRAMRESGRRIQCGAFQFSWLRREPAGAASSPAGVEPVTATPPAPAEARLGVVASSAAVGNAVARNRAKRRLREVFRRHQELVPAGCDVLLTARNAVNHTEYAVLEKKFVEACRTVFVSAKP